MTRTANLDKLTPVNVQSIINTQSAKWSGEGYDIDKEQELSTMLMEKGLNWATQKVPMVYHDTFESVPEHFALRRSDNGGLLDVVGKGYKPIQNIDAFSLFKTFMESGDVNLDTVGSFKGGSYVWGLARLKHEVTVFNKKTGDYDKTVGYMMLSNPHVQGASFIIKLISKRIVCWNTYVSALREDTPTIRMSHRTEFKIENLRNVARLSVQSCNESLSDYGNNAQKLLNFDLSFTEALPLIQSAYGIKEDIKDSMILQRLQWAYENQAGKQGNTAYDIFNGVTYFNTHFQGRSEESRLYNSVLGQQATINTKLFNSLLAVA